MNESMNLKEKDELCYFCHLPKNKCICKKGKDLYETCTVDGFDIKIRECEHEFKQNHCEPFNSAMCVQYQKCGKCDLETIFNFVERCDVCLNELQDTTEEI